MKFTDEEKDEIARLSKTYWKEILIFIFIVISVFNYWRWNETKKDLAEAIRISTVGRTITEINAGLDAMLEREKNEYPKIDANIQGLNNNINELNKKLKELQTKKANKEKINETFKKQNLNDLNKWFNDNGFPSTISTCE